MSIWNKTLKLITGVEPAPEVLHGQHNLRELIRMESRVGAQVFGPIPVSHIREFFYFDNNTWIWYEEWPDKDGQRRSLTTSYEIHSGGVIKVQQGQPYTSVEGEELRNLYLAMRLYYDRTTRQVYGRDPTTRQPLATQ